MLQVFQILNSIFKYAGIFIFLMSCKKADIDVTFFNKSQSKKTLNATISNIQIINNQVVITGTHLNTVTSLKIKEGSNVTNFQIESKNSTTITANSLSNVALLTGKILSVILADANAAATFNINFSLCDSLLGGKGFACSIVPNDKEVLSYDASSGLWKPRAVNGLNYLGTWDASTGTPPAIQPAGSYYVISQAGTIGAVNFNVGDWIASNGTLYQKIENSNTITTVHGRTGAVTSAEGDYQLDQLSDVDLTVAANVGEVLKFDGTNWVAGSVSGSAGGTVTNVSGSAPIQVTNGASAPVISISQANGSSNGYLSSADWNTFNNKESALPTGGSALQYFRGNKTLGTLDTDAVVENTNLYFTNARVLGVPLTGLSPVNSAIVATDTVLAGFNKTQGQLNAKADITNIAQTITALSVTGLAAPSAGSDAANKAYVDSAISGASAGAWSENGGNVYRPTGNIGIGTNTPNYDLTFAGDAAKELGMQRNSTINSAGQSLTIVSGGASSGGTDRSGGDLILSSGVSTGNSSSRILLQTSPQGTAGTADNTPATRMEIDGYGRTTITSVDPNLSGNNSPILNLKNIHTQYEFGHYGGISRFAVGAASGVSETTLYMTGITGVSSDMGGLRIQTDSFEISNNGTRTFNVNSAGSVGVGNTNNIAKLDVDGAIKFGTDASGCSALRAGTMRFATPNFEYCDGTNWHNLATAGSIQNTVLSSFALDAGTKPSVTTTDSIVSAFGKVQKTLNDINADYVSKSADQTINGTLAINSVTGFITVPTPLTANDAVNKAYVDSFGQWLENGSDIYFNTGNVGVGTSTPTAKLEVNGQIFSSTGGYKFPDGSVQIKAAVEGGTGGINSQVLAADKVLTTSDPIYQFLDPNGANRIVTLPTASVNSGHHFIVKHTGDYSSSTTITIRAGAVTLDILGTGKVGEWIFNGTTWVSATIGATEDTLLKDNISIGYNSKGYSKGIAIGSNAVGWQGIAIGENSTTGAGATVGNNSSAANYGAALGTLANGSQHGVGVGYLANGNSMGASVGRASNGYTNGAALGSGAHGGSYAVALGYQAGLNSNNTNTAGNGNTFIGHEAGFDGDATINSLFANKLIIANDDLETYGALIYADFASRRVNIGNINESFMQTTTSSTLNVLKNSTDDLFSASNATLGDLFIVKNSGSVGIGTATPSGMLEIMRPTADSGVILKLGDANFGFEFSREHATSGALRIQGNQPTYANILLAPTSGKVGIGIGATTIPAAKLDVGGEIKLGNTSSTCNAGTEGQQRYNSTLKIMEFCNGTAWTSMSAGGGGSGLGVGQTWQDMTGSRSLGTTYTNSTGKPIMIQILGYSGGAGGGYVYASVGGSANFPIGNWYSGGGSYPINGTLVVPDGATYVINYSITAGSPSYNQWFELR